MKFVKYVSVKPADLLPFPGNAKEHDDAELDASVGRFGQFRSVVARQLPDGSYQLLAGHGTTDALARAELAKVRVELVEATDDEAVEMVVAENAIGRRAGFNESALAALLRQIDESGRGFTGVGVTSAEYDDLMAKLAAVAETPLPLGEGEADTTWKTANMQDLRDRYETKGTRTVSFDYPYPVFVWLAEQLAILREREEVESNSELFLLLVGRETDSTPPESLDEDAGPEEPEDDASRDDGDHGGALVDIEPLEPEPVTPDVIVDTPSGAPVPR
jgi:ParB-like nuclease domain